MLAIAPDLVRDINQLPDPSASSNPNNLVTIGATTYFAATDNLHGRELWKTDGTSAGTVLLRDIQPGAIGSTPTYLTNVNGTLFFQADDGTHGSELWKSDGTCNGTVLVKDVIPGSAGSGPSNFSNLNGTLLFFNRDSSLSYGLWKSDGTSAGTVLVRVVRPSPDSSHQRYLTVCNQQLFFETVGDVLTQLWKSDGTSSGTVMLKDFQLGASLVYGTNVNGVLFFRAFDSTHADELWKSDGTSSGTVLVRDINPRLNASSNPVGLTNVNGTLFFRATDGVSGYELWKSNGTSSGTEMVRDIELGSLSSNPTSLANVNGTLYFNASSGSLSGLWKSDGTSSGTVFVKTFAPGLYVDPRYIRNVQGSLFMLGNSASTGNGFWKSDGTSSGTVLLKTASTWSSQVFPSTLTNSANGKVLFEEYDMIHGLELWTSDGTSNGTTLVRDIHQGSSSSNPKYLTNVNGTLYFQANDTTHGSELWRSDYTNNNTSLVADVNTVSFAGSNPKFLTNVSGTLYFQADNGITGSELWRTNGTSSGTILVKDIFTGTSGSNPSFLTNVNGTLFFKAQDATHGYELWKSDGTSSGTVLVKDILAGTGSATLSSFVNMNGALYFSADDGVHGSELWSSDGTSAGTRLVKDVNPGTSSSNPGSLTNINGILYFSATDGVNSTGIWKSDGTSNGTDLVRDFLFVATPPSEFTNFNGSLYFEASPFGSYGLWTTDGTSAGTRRVILTAPSFITESGGELYFQGNTSNGDSELWKSDGTSNGTTLVANLNATGSSYPKFLTNILGRLYFTATDGSHGVELWSSDGTSAGTIMAGDVNLGTASFNPSNLVNICGHLFFAADNGIVGIELWRVNSDPIVSLSSSTTSIAETGGSARVTATLDLAGTQDVTVVLGFRGSATLGSDYSASSATITIPAGQTSGSITLFALDDATYEGAESIVADIVTVLNGAENDTQSVTIAVTDNESQPSVSLQITGSPIAENGGSATVHATLSNLSTQDVVINLAFSGTAQNGSDFTASSNAIVIVAGQSTGIITLTCRDDLTFESDESVVVDVTTVSNATENGSQSVTTIILDDDPLPSVSLQLNGDPLDERAGVATVAVTLSNPSAQNIQVQLGFGGTALRNVDYSASSDTITILAGQTAGVISLTALDDSILETDETIVIDVLSVTNGTENGSQSVTALIVDDESRPTVDLSLSSGTANENGGTIIVFATLDSPSTRSVTVTVGLSGSATPGTDYSIATNTIAFLPGATSGFVTLTMLDDLLLEGNETILIDFLSTINAKTSGSSQVTASIVDDSGDPFQLIGNSLTLLGTTGDDLFSLNYGGSTSSYTATINGVSGTFSATTIQINGGSGQDTLNLTLSSLADTAKLGGLSGSVTSSNYAISFSNFETAVLFGSATDRATFNDPGAVNTFTFLSAYSIMKSTTAGYTNQTVGFGGSTGNGVDSNDSIFLYGDSGNQTLIASPTQVRMTVGTQPLVGNNIRNAYVYGTLSGSAGTDSATYNGSSADEVLTATPGYSIVSSLQTLQYFVGFKSVTANSGGGLDSAKMYDSAGNDTFNSSTTTARFFGATFDYRANGYTRIYAYQTRGNDTATLNGTAGDDRVIGNSAYVILSTGSFIQQAFNFSTVIVNAGTGTDTATLDDSIGNDTLNASSGLAELIYANGHKIQVNGFDTVTARGANGGVNRRNVTGTLAYVLRFTDTWV